MEGRLALLAVVGLLFAWFVFGVAVREPYPAAVFPRFGSVPVDEEILPVRFRILIFTAGDRTAELTLAETFDGAFDSFHNSMLDSLVKAGPEETVDDPEFVAWLEDRAETSFGWECVDGLEIVERVSDSTIAERSLQSFQLDGCR